LIVIEGQILRQIFYIEPLGFRGIVAGADIFLSPGRYAGKCD